MHVTGGAVRDWLLGRFSRDLDITIDGDAIQCGRDFARQMHAAFIPLDEDERVARVVRGDCSIDFSSLREGTTTITDDLRLRDFTINALAVPFTALRQLPGRAVAVIDPTGGENDLHRRIVRATSAAVFQKDPLRLLRAYRFMAELDFSLEAQTEGCIRRHAALISQAAPERISYELGKIMASERAAAMFERMLPVGLLTVIFPELGSGKGLSQPASHHLDVLGHSLKALHWMEKIQQQPAAFFPSGHEDFSRYLAEGNRAVLLKWAALFHDLGKPSTYALRDERITFYSHDSAGSREFVAIGKRLRWSREETQMVARFIALHMWPFHLRNASRKNGLTARACLRLTKAAGNDLAGLFLLAMADSLAGQGPGKPAAMEASLARLYTEVKRVYAKAVRPVMEQPRLLTGHDLREIFDLAPGPIYKEILTGLESAQVENTVRTRADAIAWVRSFLAGS